MLVTKFLQSTHLYIFQLLILTIKCEDYENRTYAGSEIDITRVPFTVIISPVGCTGALIHPQRVLTAAHCFANEKTGIYAGFGSSDKESCSYFIKGENIFFHPEFFKYYFSFEAVTISKYDLAIVILVSPATLSTSVQLLNLEETDWPETVDRKCILAGYGRNIFHNTKLHESHMIAKHGSNSCACMTENEIVCADEFEIIKGRKVMNSPCYGDSGSLLLCDKKGVGVTSQAVPLAYCAAGFARAVGVQLSDSVCGRKGFIYLFTYIQPNLEWIKSITNEANKLSFKSVHYYELFRNIQFLAFILHILV